MRYRIMMVREDPIKQGKSELYEKEVEGEPFPIFGWEEFQFFKRIEDDLIIISEVTTGLQVGDYYSSDIAAHDDIQARLEKKGRDAVRKLIEDQPLPKQAQLSAEKEV